MIDYPNMKIFIDTNIVLDLLLDREILSLSSGKILSLCEENKVDGYISSSSITDIYYLIKKHTHDNALAQKAIIKLISFLQVAPVDGEDIFNAYSYKANDFEDALVSVIAKKMKCSYLITRNLSDFAGLDIEVVTPEAFLEIIEK